MSGEDILRIFGIAERTLQSWIAEGMPVRFRGCGGRPSAYDALEVAAWRHARQGGPDQEGQGDLFPDLGASPALEEFRRHRARHSRLNADLVEGLRVEREEVMAIVMDVLPVLRVELELLERVHGRLVGDEIRAILQRLEASSQGGLEAIALQIETEERAPRLAVPRPG